MGHYCKNHIVLAIASAVTKAKDGKVTIEKTTGKCNWSGCSTPDVDIHLLTYVGQAKKTTSTQE